MTATYHPIPLFNYSVFNRTDGRAPNEKIEKDIQKWVESVRELKAAIKKPKPSQDSVEKPAKILKKRKVKRKPSHEVEGVVTSKNVSTSVQPPQTKPVKIKPQQSIIKKPGLIVLRDKKSRLNRSSQVIDAFDAMKENYKMLTLPPRWTSGISASRLVFNRIKVSSHNTLYEMTAERGILIAGDCSVHVFVDGYEVCLNDWEMRKVDNLEDVKKAILAVDSFKVCSGLPNGSKSPYCSTFLEGDKKTCRACKSDSKDPLSRRNSTISKRPTKVLLKSKDVMKSKSVVK